MYTSLALHNFRSYSRYAVALGSGVTIVVGPNGSGKTNLLEALYVLSTGSSFRAADRDIIARGSDWFRLEGVWDGQQRVLTYRAASGQPAEKQFVLDGAKRARITHAQRVPVVLFEPDHLQLLRGGPAARRDYLDALLARLQPDFSWLKHQLERVLLQRNNVLKQRISPSQIDDYLFAWDVSFAELAQTVVAQRRELVQTFGERLSDVYSAIAHKPSRVHMDYVSTVSGPDYQAQALRLLRHRRAEDRARGFTTVGPQRDDFRLLLNHAPAETSASRGEMRTLLLALKIIELELMARQSDHTPLLLLDDVFSELDATRRIALAKAAGRYQTIVTTTDYDAVDALFSNTPTVITTVTAPDQP